MLPEREQASQQGLLKALAAQVLEGRGADNSLRLLPS